MFRFTIRDVLWLTVVVALACGWWISDTHSQREIERRELEIQLLREARGVGV